MSHWSARCVTPLVTIALMTQPGLAASRSASATKRAPAKHGTTAGHTAAASPSRPGAENAPASAVALDKIMKRGEDVSAGIRLRHEDRLAALTDAVTLDGNAAPAAMIDRLSHEFGVSAAGVQADHDGGQSWGEIVIARTLRANVRQAITPAQIVELHRDGMAWTMVAYGLGLDPDQFAKAVESEGRIARGDDKPDGRVAPIGAVSTSASVEP